MPTDVMTLSEYAEMLADLAERWGDDEPAVLIGDVTGSVSVSEQDGHSTYGCVGYAQEVFPGNGVYELGQQTDGRFYGTMLIDPDDLADEAQESLLEAEYEPATAGGDD